MLLLWPGEVRRKREDDSGRTGPALFAGTNNQDWVEFFFCQCPVVDELNIRYQNNNDHHWQTILIFEDNLNRPCIFTRLLFCVSVCTSLELFETASSLKVPSEKIASTHFTRGH